MTFSLFLLMDAIGNVPIFLAILKEIDFKRQRYIIFRELLIALFIIVSFYFIGEYLLLLLKISQQAVLISGGMILFIIALKMIFPSGEKGFKWEGGKEPFLVPLAIPLVSGPAVLAAVMLYSHQQVTHWMALLAILLAWLATTVILVFSIHLKKLLGDRGLSACEKLTGLLLIMISVQMFLDGLKYVFST